MFIFYASWIVRLFALWHGNTLCINNLTSLLVYLRYAQCFALCGCLPYSCRHLFQSHHPKTSYLKGKEQTCPLGMFNFGKVLSDGESWRAANFSTVQRKFVMALLRDWSQLCTSCKHQNMWQCQLSSSHKYTWALLKEEPLTAITVITLLQKRILQPWQYREQHIRYSVYSALQSYSQPS